MLIGMRVGQRDRGIYGSVSDHRICCMSWNKAIVMRTAVKIQITNMSYEFQN